MTTFLFCENKQHIQIFPNPKFGVDWSLRWWRNSVYDTTNMENCYMVYSPYSFALLMENSDIYLYYSIFILVLLVQPSPPSSISCASREESVHLVLLWVIPHENKSISHSMEVSIVHAALLAEYSSCGPYKSLIFHCRFLVGSCE